LYRSFYGLTRKPFDNVPDPDFFYDTAKTREVFDCLKFSVRQEGVISLLLGRDGCGKTLLVRKLLKEMQDSCELAHVSGSLNTPEEFLGEILYQLQGTEIRDSKDTLLRKIGEHLFNTVNSNRKSLIVFDGVTGIVKDEILVELRQLLDLQLDDRTLAAFLIVGNGELESAITSSIVKERISVIARLKSLSLLESIAYMNFRLKAAGASEDLFTIEAKAAVSAAARGVPGQINALADLSLFYGFRNRLKPVDLQAVDMAISRNSIDEVSGSSQEAQ
jgi:general secretion pathway protein A